MCRGLLVYCAVVSLVYHVVGILVYCVVTLLVYHAPSLVHQELEHNSWKDSREGLHRAQRSEPEHAKF